MSRYIIRDSAQYSLVEAILDEAGIDYEWDSGDRLMVEDDFCEDVELLFDDNDIDYDYV
jgi:hypothetical protein